MLWFVRESWFYQPNLPLFLLLRSSLLLPNSHVAVLEDQRKRRELHQQNAQKHLGKKGLSLNARKGQHCSNFNKVTLIKIDQIDIKIVCMVHSMC